MKKGNLPRYAQVIFFTLVLQLSACGDSSDSSSPPNDSGVHLTSIDYDRQGVLPWSMPMGSSLQFHAIGEDGSGQSLDISTKVSWSSTNPNVVSVDTNGLVSTKGLGESNITATSATTTISYKVAVKDMQMSIQSPTAFLFIADPITMEAGVTTNAGGIIDTRNFVQLQVLDSTDWSLNEQGQIVINTAGEYTVKANYFDVSTTQKVSVSEPLTIQVVNTDYNQIELAWTEVYTTENYNLRWLIDGVVLQQGSVSGTNLTSYIHSQLPADASVTYELEVGKTVNGNLVTATSGPFISYTKGNNSDVLTADVIGSQAFDNTVLIKTVAVNVTDAGSYNIQLGPAYLRQQYPDNRINNRINIVIPATNMDSTRTLCLLELTGIDLMDSAGNVLTSDVLSIVIGSERKAVDTDYASTCVPPGRTGYFTLFVQLNSVTLDQIDHITASNFLDLSVFSQFPAMEVIPTGYTVTPVSDGTNVNSLLHVTILNRGSQSAKINTYSNYILLDENANPVDYGVLKTDTNWNGILDAGQTNVITGNVSFEGSAASVKVFIDFDPAPVTP